MKIALLSASLILVAGSVAGCGGGSPNDASEGDFCKAALSGDALNAGADVTGKAVKDYAKHLEDVGTPKDIPDDARDGFDLFIKTAKALDDDASAEDLADADKDFSDDDQKAFEAYTTYLGKTCADALKDQLSDIPTPDAS